MRALPIHRIKEDWGFGSHQLSEYHKYLEETLGSSSTKWRFGYNYVETDDGFIAYFDTDVQLEKLIELNDNNRDEVMVLDPKSLESPECLAQVIKPRSPLGSRLSLVIEREVAINQEVIAKKGEPVNIRLLLQMIEQGVPVVFMTEEG